MLIENKEKIQYYLEQLPDKYLSEVVEYLRFLEFKINNKNVDKSSILLFEQSLSKEWLTIDEDESWKDL
ncbi:MAG TPA: hypothetical protein VFI29_00450 [Hanamia sp.]|nr:hypothetical protein [Hanamia sp.]